MPDRKEGWVPLVEYAVRRGVSLSTLRRQIKANKIQFRLENGKYFLFDADEGLQALRRSQRASAGSGASSRDPQAEELQSRVQLLEDELRRAQVEIAELKTLVALYEETV